LTRRMLKLICVISLFLIVLAKVPTKADIKRHLTQKPGELPWLGLETLFGDDIEFYNGGTLMAKGKKSVMEAVHSMPVVKQDSTVLSILISGNVATVYRQTQVTGTAGCTSLISALDEFHFNEQGKVDKAVWYPNKDLNTILSEANCNPTFSPKVLEDIVRKANLDGESFPWESSSFEKFFHKDVEVSVLPGAPRIKGITSFLEMVNSLPYKSFIISIDYVFAAGNTAVAHRSVWGTTKSGCTFFTRDVVKTEHSYPDGKVKLLEFLSMETNEDKCGTATKTEL